ncbi:unnamed protein product [Rotaria magnacalcarata]|uniref:Ubiquitin-like domain-containing protein n=2 Tax=Rotaria magnacalcarata TaxID=392030 RepID=A0A816ZCX1_9BILA|nr:unnamed protein product [Rotaria magnacalcarata]CAF2199986.1 unnamed protein product [Rotaria magnacalcarata]CAF3799359.1 unnamed protein product [Rotaria magnacalcarata]CAF3959083.1 unnamed protein product [Rotaria magnacalcarata]
MSFIEGVGDDLLYAFSFLGFLGIIILAWFSSHVNNIHLPATLFIIERRTRLRNDNEQAERESSSPSRDLNSPNEQTPLLSSTNETSTEHESDNDSSENDEYMYEQTPTSVESNTSQTQESPLDPNESEFQIATDEQEDQSLRITIKFLNETQKSILANANDTIFKVKRLYFADELASNKIVRFIYQGRELQDSETLRTCNIRDQTTIHCQISIRRLPTPNQINDNTSGGHVNTNGFDTLSLIDTSPISISPYFMLLMTLMLGSVWYLRIKYRILFTPISTIVLLLITIILLIFTCGLLLTARRQVSDTRIPAQLRHVHLD